MLCAHCDRPICTDCMVEARVGWQCPSAPAKEPSAPATSRPSPTRAAGRTGVVGSTNPTPVVLVIIAINVVVFFLEGFGTNNRVIDPLRALARRRALAPPVLPGLHGHVAARQLRAHLLQHDHPAHRRARPRGAPGQGALHRPVPAGRPGRERRLVPPRPAQRARHRGVGRHHGRAGRLHRGGPAPPAAGGARGHPAGLQPRHRLHRATPTGGPTSAAWWSAASSASLYDYAGDLRDAKTGLVLTVGGSVAMLALLALLITSIAPGTSTSN